MYTCTALITTQGQQYPGILCPVKCIQVRSVRLLCNSKDGEQKRISDLSETCNLAYIASRSYKLLQLKQNVIHIYIITNKVFLTRSILKKIVFIFNATKTDVKIASVLYRNISIRRMYYIENWLSTVNLRFATKRGISLKYICQHVQVVLQLNN